MELVSPPHETLKKWRKMAMRVLGRRVARRGAFNYSVIVSWEELTSSKLLAQSYEEAGTRALTTDYRLPTTKSIAVASPCTHQPYYFTKSINSFNSSCFIL